MIFDLIKILVGKKKNYKNGGKDKIYHIYEDKKETQIIRLD